MKVIEDYRWHDLSIMNDEDIDYEANTSEVLADLAFCGELYIATSSVLELSSRESKFVVPVTWKILSNSVLSEVQRQELDHRLEAYSQNPEAGVPWDQVKERIKKLV